MDEAEEIQEQPVILMQQARSPIIRVRKRTRKYVPPPTVLYEPQTVESTLEKKDNLPSELVAGLRETSNMNKTKVHSPLVAETASAGQEADTPSMDTYCSAAELSQAKNQTKNYDDGFDLDATYCSAVENSLNMESISSENNALDSLEKIASSAAKNFTEMETQNYFECEDSHYNNAFLAPNEESSVEHHESFVKKKRGKRGRKRLSSLVILPDSGSHGRSVRSQTKLSQSSSVRSSSQSSQQMGLFQSNGSVTISSSQYLSQGPFTRRQRLTRSSEKDIKEQVSNLVDCVRAVRQVVRTQVTGGGKLGTNPSQIVNDIANIQQKAQQLLKQYGQSQDLQHVLQACESMNLQMRYVPYRCNSQTSATQSQLPKKQIVSKQDISKAASQDPCDQTCGLPSFTELVDAGLLLPGKSSLCLLLKQCLPVRATVSPEGYIQAPNGIMYTNIEDWCRIWARDAKISRADAYEFTFYEGQSLISLCAEVPKLYKENEIIENSQERMKISQVVVTKNNLKPAYSESKLKSGAVKSEKVLFADKKDNLPTEQVDNQFSSADLVEETPSLPLCENHKISSDEETYFSEPDTAMSPGSSLHKNVEISGPLSSIKPENTTSVSVPDIIAPTSLADSNLEISLIVSKPEKTVNTIIPKPLYSENLEMCGVEKNTLYTVLKNAKTDTSKSKVEYNSDHKHKPFGIFKIKSSFADMDCQVNKTSESENKLKTKPSEETKNEKENAATSVKTVHLYGENKTPGTLHVITTDNTLCSEESKTNSVSKTIDVDKPSSIKASKHNSTSKANSPDKSKVVNKINLTPTEISKLKARSQELVKKLDNEIYIPARNMISVTPTESSKHQLICGMKDNIQKYTTAAVSPWEDKKSLDQMTEEEQVEWRIRMKAKMLAKWNADVQAWGNVDPSPSAKETNDVCLQTIPRYVPEYKKSDHNCSIQSHESTIQALEQLAVMMKNVQDMVSQLSSSNSVASIDKKSNGTQSSQKFNTPSSQSQHYASLLSISKPSISARYSQSEEPVIVNEDSQEGSQRSYSRGSGIKTSHPRIFQRLSCSQSATEKFQGFHSQQNVQPAETLTPHKTNNTGAVGTSVRNLQGKATSRASTSAGGFNRRTPSKVSFQTTSSVISTARNSNSQPWN